MWRAGAPVGVGFVRYEDLCLFPVCFRALLGTISQDLDLASVKLEQDELY